MADAGLVLRQTMTDIASAIRTKGGASGNLRPSEMAQAILAISGGGGGEGGGNNILYGVETPTSDVGEDGDLYIKTHAYTKDFTCDPEYLVISTTQRLSTQTRAFYKTVEGPAIAVHYHWTGDFYGPLLVSTNPEYVKYTDNTGAPLGSATIDGTTWYLSSTQYWNHDSDNPTIPTMYDVPELGGNVNGLISEILSRSHAHSSGETDYIIDEFYLKVNGAWILAPGRSISEVNLSGGGGDTPSEDFLPASDAQKVVCLAHPNNFSPTAAVWGTGGRPIFFTTAGASQNGATQNADRSIKINAYSSGVVAYVDLGAEATPFTAYLVGKVDATSGAYARILMAMSSAAAGRGISSAASLSNEYVCISQWGDTPAVPSPSVPISSYFVVAIRFSAQGNAAGTAISVSSSPATPTLLNRTPSTAGRYVTVGRTTPTGSQEATPSDMSVKFMGVVSEAESDAVIIQNVMNLARYFAS